MTRRAVWLRGGGGGGRGAALALLAVLSGCAYYNAMWSAERYAKEARRLEARGQEAEARAQWALAAVKAESVIARHPRSRWADDALVLQAEGLARAGSCATAAAPLPQARALGTPAALRGAGGGRGSAPGRPKPTRCSWRRLPPRTHAAARRRNTSQEPPPRHGSIMAARSSISGGPANPRRSPLAPPLFSARAR